MRSIGVIFPRLCWIIKSQSRARFLSSCGFVHLEHLELGVFIKGGETNKIHQNIKAPEESVSALLKPRHQEHFEGKGVPGEVSAHRLAWAVVAVMLEPGVQAPALNRESGALRSLFCPGG